MSIVAILLMVIGALALVAAIVYYFKYRYGVTYQKSRMIEALAIVGVVLIFSGIVIVSSLSPVP